MEENKTGNFAWIPQGSMVSRALSIAERSESLPEHHQQKSELKTEGDILSSNYLLYIHVKN